MGTGKLGSYIVQYRSRKREAAEEEKRRKIEDQQRRPAIIDPSYELFGYTSPPAEQPSEDAIQDTHTSPLASASDDWLFQPRRASTLPQSSSFEPHCEVTPKSSVSSTKSTASDAPRQEEYDMGWETMFANRRPRPQSYLPSSASATYSLSMTDLHRSSEYKSRTHSGLATIHQRQDSLPSYEHSQNSSSSYKLGATLTRPFSINDPLEAILEPARGDPCCNAEAASQFTNGLDDRLSKIPENDATGANVTDHVDDLVKNGYRV